LELLLSLLSIVYLERRTQKKVEFGQTQGQTYFLSFSMRDMEAEAFGDRPANVCTPSPATCASPVVESQQERYGFERGCRVLVLGQDAYQRLLGPARDAKLCGDNCDEWKTTGIERSKQEASALHAQDGILAWERASEFSLRAQEYTVHTEATPKCGLAAFAGAHRGQLRIVGVDSFSRFRQSMSPYMSRIRCAVDSYPPSHSCTLP
jgi:hypothetical protein